MRQIILDTETTGLSPQQGHRIIEIGALEMVNRRLTGKQFHYYLNPDRDVDYGAQQVHGISTEFLKDKPRFAEIHTEFIEFVQNAELIIHNASFDVNFLNHELKRVNKNHALIEEFTAVTDSLSMARKKHPGQKNSLDALTKRYDINCFDRDLHGALLDAKILAQVYLAMTGGQEDLSFHTENTATIEVQDPITRANNANYKVICANTEELAQHDAYVKKIKEAGRGKCIYLQD